MEDEHLVRAIHSIGEAWQGGPMKRPANENKAGGQMIYRWGVRLARQGAQAIRDARVALCHLSRFGSTVGGKAAGLGGGICAPGSCS